METTTIVDPECVRVLQKHAGPVLNVKFTQNGTYCMSTSQDKSLILWNPIRGTAIHQYKKPHNHEINDVSMTTDNSRFVSCGGDKFAFLWDVTTGDVIRKFGGHNGKLYCCEIAADNSLLLTGCYDKAVRIFDLRAYQRNRPLQSLEDARDTISRILTASIDGQFRCYDMRAGRVYADKFPGPIVAGGLSRDKRCYIVNCLDNSIHLVELDSGQHLNTYRGHKHNNYILNSQISPDDAYIVSGSEDGRICIWDICPDECLPGATVQELQPSTTSVSKDALTFEELQNQQRLDTDSKQRADWGCVFTVRFHPELWYFISCHNDRHLRVWKRSGESFGS